MKDAPSPRAAPIADFLARHAHLIALALFAIVGIAVLDDYGIAPDEGTQRKIGYASFNYILGNADSLTGYSLESDRYYGVAFELPLIAVERLLRLEDSRAIYLSRHLLTHALFLAGGFFAWLLAYRLFGSRLVALLAMLLFLLHPRIYAHSFFNSKDLPFLSMFMVALYLTHRAFRRDGVWAFALCGAGVALLTNMRVIGIMLLPAVLGMLALDAFHAMRRGGNGVKRALANMGAFSAAFGAILYASWPLLWRDPLELIEAFWVMSAHPSIYSTLFRGEWARWPDMPWDYVPTWILITTPPVALILAALGTAHVARLCAAGWRGMFANSTARFGLLAVACAVLPVAAVIALNSNLYHDWRQMYFLYAPLCVLAAFGLRFIAALPKPNLRAAAFALAALGIALAAVQMVRLHPVQNDYFNPLADKSALADRWEVNYWGVSHRQALERMLSIQPAGRVSVNSCSFSAWALDRNLKIIPREDRLRTVVNWFAPDFCVGKSVKNPAWTREIYGAPIVSLADNRESARRAYMDAYELAKSREPDFKAHFDVHVADGLIVYLREPCAEGDVAGTFAISERPVHPDNAPDFAPDGGERFGFWDYGRILGAACVMARRLPDYPLESLNVAYRPLGSDRELWSAEIPVNNHIKAYESATSSEPLARSGFDIYEDGGRLIYVKRQCAESDARGRFALTVYPVDLADLPQDAQDAGADSESLNFDFWRYGAIFDGKCVIARPLPDYPISHVITAQWLPGEGGLWDARIPFAGYYERFRDALAGLSGETPVANAGGFDIYADDKTLTYVKADCAESDARGRFALTVHPVDRGDLPQAAQDAGADGESLNFDFAEHGAIFDGRCVIIRELPDYPISHVVTAQWIPGEGGLWDVRVLFDGYYERFRDALAGLSGETPVASTGGFAIYADDKTLTYVKTDCAESDARGRFALTVHPVDQSDLPQDTQDAGADGESLNFDFAEHGAIFDGRCVIIRELPDYPISHVVTAQWIPGEGGLWDVRVLFAGYYNRFRDALSALPPEPNMSGGGFDIYLDGGTLTYVRTDCDEDDTRGRFALSVFPVDRGDLPRSAREAGLEHQPLNFDFAEHGAIFDGGCVIIRELPDYQISRIETGQWIPGEGGLWSAEMAVGE